MMLGLPQFVAEFHDDLDVEIGVRGQRFEPRVSCSACGEAIAADAVETLGGPGGAMKPGTRVLARRLRAAREG